MKPSTGSLNEWLWPTAFLLCAGFTVWHIPAFILDWAPPDESLFRQIAALHTTKEVTPNLPGLFGGFADIIDYLALIGIPITFFFGARNMRLANMELQEFRRWDLFAMFVGRVVMILILAMTSVMLYEVFVRYVLDNGTYWANELTLWLGGFLFLCSGLYAMQQRSHIRIFLLYDVVPRWMQRIFDTISTFLICLFAFGLVFGSYNQVFINKFYRWEMFGTAFDPPIPATVQPMVLIIIVLVALQSVLNLIADWNKEPEVHTAADDIDEDELAAIKRSVGVE